MYNNYFFFFFSPLGISEPDYKVRKNTETRYNAFNNPHKGQSREIIFYIIWYTWSRNGAWEKTKSNYRGSVMYREPRPPPASLHTARLPLGCSRLPRSREGFPSFPLSFYFLTTERAYRIARIHFFFFFNNNNSLKNISIQFQIIEKWNPDKSTSSREKKPKWNKKTKANKAPKRTKVSWRSQFQSPRSD